jgi:hypothetical protein
VLEWNADWASDRRVAGQVRSIGTVASRLFLFPVHGSSKLDRIEARLGMQRWVGGRRSPQIPTDRVGNYAIEIGDPVPRLIAAGLAYEGHWGTQVGVQIVETFLPGESIEVHTGSIEFRCSDASPSKTVRVEIEMPPSALRYPLHSFLTTREANWDTRVPLVIHGIPIAVRSVQLDDTPVPVSVKSAQVTVVELGGVLGRSPGAAK